MVGNVLFRVPRDLQRVKSARNVLECVEKYRAHFNACTETGDRHFEHLL